MRRKLGLKLSQKNFASSIRRSRFSVCSFAHLRNGQPLLLDNSAADVFNALCESNKEELWILASREPDFGRHPLSGDTVLHLLARSTALTTEQKLRVLENLKKDYRNPLIPNYKNKRAIDLTTDPVLKQQLAVYMEFRCDGRVLEWYGPMLRLRL